MTRFLKREPMIEWKILPRSIRYTSADAITADVWPFMASGGKVFKWTVRDEKTGVYLCSGEGRSQDDACEMALRFMNI